MEVAPVNVGGSEHASRKRQRSEMHSEAPVQKPVRKKQLRQVDESDEEQDQMMLESDDDNY